MLGALRNDSLVSFNILYHPQSREDHWDVAHMHEQDNMTRVSKRNRSLVFQCNEKLM